MSVRDLRIHPHTHTWTQTHTITHTHTHTVRGLPRLDWENWCLWLGHKSLTNSLPCHRPILGLLHLTVFLVRAWHTVHIWTWCNMSAAVHYIFIYISTVFDRQHYIDKTSFIYVIFIFLFVPLICLKAGQYLQYIQMLHDIEPDIIWEFACNSVM